MFRCTFVAGVNSLGCFLELCNSSGLEVFHRSQLVEISRKTLLDMVIHWIGDTLSEDIPFAEKGIIKLKRDGISHKQINKRKCQNH